MGVGGKLHHGSKGQYYSFGNVGCFKKINNSIITEYVNKRSANKLCQENINKNSSYYDEFSSDVLQKAIECLNKYLPGVKKLISSSVNVSYEKSIKTNKDIGLKNQYSKKNGLWCRQIYINAQS